MMHIQAMYDAIEIVVKARMQQWCNKAVWEYLDHASNYLSAELSKEMRED